MTESPWTTRYWELVARHELLLQLRSEGEFDKREWNALIAEMKAHGMWAMENDIRREMEVEE